MYKVIFLIVLAFAGSRINAQNDFITTWKTDNPGSSNSTSITIPTGGYVYNYDVSWENNGVWEMGFTGNATHDYGTAGTYTVAIRGSFPRIYFNNTLDRQKILSIEQWGDNVWTSMRNAFSGCSNLDCYATDVPDFSVVTTMSRMFSGASSLNQDMSEWNVSNVTDISYMFNHATAFNQNIGSWDLSNVTTTRGMFAGAKNFNQDIGDWDVSSVTDMAIMFSSAEEFNQDLNDWNVSSVTDMGGMFAGATNFNGAVSNWDVSNVTDMFAILENTSFSTENYDALLIGWSAIALQHNIIFGAISSSYCDGNDARQIIINDFGWAIFDDGLSADCGGTNPYFITTWQTYNSGSPNPTSITIPTKGSGYNYDVSWENNGVWETGFTGNAFHDYATAGIHTVAIRGSFPRIYFNDSLVSKKIKSIVQWGDNEWTSMGNAFFGCGYMVNNASDVPDLSGVTDMSNMFRSAWLLNSNIDNWDVSNVTDMSYMLANAVSFDQDISNWDVSNVTNMSHMFEYANDFNQDINNWDVSNVTNMAFMFSNAKVFNQNLHSWDVSSVTDMTEMFAEALPFDQDLSDWDVSNVSAMSGMLWDTNLSSSHYDALLISWSALALQNNVSFDAGSSTYCAGSDAKQSMISDFGWTITDGGFSDGCAVTSNYFITKWKTDNEGASSATSIIIPTEGDGYNYDVSWENNGVWETGFTGDATHDYGSAGTYTVAIRGSFPRIYFNDSLDCTKIISIKQWGDNEWTSMGNAFFGCRNMVSNASDMPDLSGVTDMSYMFQSASLYNNDIGNWDVSSVTDMSNMFNGAWAFNQNINNWDVSNVTDMAGMFRGAEVFNQEISNWDVSNVTDVSNMFTHASSFNQDIGDWDVSNVTNMARMFEYANIFNQNIDNWDVSNVTNMSHMFANAYEFNKNLNSWDVSNVNDMYYMFKYATAFNGQIGNWDLSSVTDMFGMFIDAAVFNQDIGNWDVSNVTTMALMFSNTGAFNQAIGNWDVGNVTDVSRMFANADAFNQSLNNWDVSSVTDMSSMFFNADIFDQDLNSWDVGSVTDMRQMFQHASLSTANYDALLIGWSALVLQNNIIFHAGNSTYCAGSDARQNMISNFGWTIADGGLSDSCNDASNYFITTWKTDNQAPFNLTSITIPTQGSGYNYDVSWKNNGVWETGFTGNAFHDYGMAGTYTVAIRGSFPRIDFGSSIDDLKILSIEQWGNIEWTSMEAAFVGCRNLVGNASDTPDLSGVTDMSFMFAGAWAFNQDINNWDVSNVTDMSGMFSGAKGFNQPIGDWDVSNVTDLSTMFWEATLFNQDISNWDVSSVTDIYGMFYYAQAFNQDIGNWNVSGATDMSEMFAGAEKFNQDIGTWDVGNLTSMYYIFANAYEFDQDLSNWDVSNVTDMTGALQSTSLSTVNYDALLNGWNALTLQNDVVFDGGPSTYCDGADARENMISNLGWIITDGGSIIGKPCDFDGVAGAYGADCSCIPLMGIIAGAVDWNGACGERNATIEIQSVEAPYLTETFDTIIDEYGDFSTTEFLPGTYNVLIKMEGYLAKLFPALVVSEDINSVYFGYLNQGDLNGDNMVNFMDLSAISASFLSVSTDVNYLADLNCDGYINILDVSLLNVSFGMVGDALNDSNSLRISSAPFRENQPKF